MSGQALLERLPALATTGVGSLPFTSVDAAVRYVLHAYELPFCPQLPRRDGDMISEWLGADPARCGWSPARDRERPVAWDAFLEALVAAPPVHGVVKLQVTGPLTLAVALERDAGRCGFGPDVPGLARELSAWLAASVTAQSRALADHGLSTLLVAMSRAWPRPACRPMQLPSGTRCARLPSAGGCTSAARSRGDLWTPQRRTCSHSTSNIALPELPVTGS